MSELTWDKKVAFYQGIAEAVLADAIMKKVLPSLTMAQAALESDYGQSQLASQYKNLFGVKGSGTAGSVSLPTTEYDEHGNPRHVNADFAVYASVADSIAAHSELFHIGTSDDPDRYKPVLAASTAREACQAVQACGYATDPNYAKELYDVIDIDGLTGYDDQYRERLAAPVVETQAEAAAPAAEEAAPAPVEALQPVSELDDALAWAERVGLIQGDGTGDFGATQPLQRGHFVIVIKRMFDKGFLVKGQ